MADEPLPDEEAATEQTPSETGSGLRGRIARLLAWAKASKLRMALVGTLALTVFGGTFATWSYLAHLVVQEEGALTLEMALDALDAGEYEKAKNIVADLQKQSTPNPEFGGALFVLGAVKASQAESEWSQERQRAMHLVAARYLQKSRELGIPEDRESQVEFLIGQSLIKGNQPRQGITILEKLLTDESLPSTKMHALLSDAHQSTSEVNLPAALRHNQAVLSDPALPAEQRNAAIVAQADILARMGRHEEARQQLAKADNGESQPSRIKSISGRLALSQAQQLSVGSQEHTSLIDQALADLREARQLDPLGGELTRQAMYWIGKCYEALDNEAAAIQEYEQLNKSYGDTNESTAAMLSKADLVQKSGRSKQALIDYRAVLGAVGNPRTYVNRLLPIVDLRKRMLRANNNFLESQQFEEALTLVNALQPVFDLREVTEQRAQVHQAWGAVELEEAGQAAAWNAKKYLTEGRQHHRAAGRDFELLAKLRFASRDYTESLWRASENYYKGQSYTHAERMLDKYLHHEALKRQALALLRLGQTQLAQGKNAQAVESLTECIELHPHDAVVYQARLECAQAHLDQGQGKLAEELLLTNLAGGSLTPTASEWQDSLFMLGKYLHNSDQYYEAIAKLDEAVTRYPDAPQSLLARYNIARSYHRASQGPAKIAQEAKTESERQKNRKIRDQNLESALENYLKVQRMLTLQGHLDSNDLERMLLRNCYMMQGSVLFQLKRYEDARKAYANISTLYQSEPFVLESFVHIANCYRRLNKPVKAKGTIEQAKLVLKRLPSGTDFKFATNFSRQSWEILLNEMGEW